MLCPLTTELRCVYVHACACECLHAVLRTNPQCSSCPPLVHPHCSSCHPLVHTHCSPPSVQDYVCLSNYPVLIISYEMFVRTYEVVKRMTFDLIVCDEGHRLKNTTIKTTSVRAYSVTQRTLHCI